ncbi:MAG: hypothetical protein SFV54_23945 [Bryobacteraceae bacterium]|nr:hypothetical protein [Bryobacteraceae bacterium]
MKRAVVCAGALVLATTGLRADFSYEQTTKIAGGAMAGVMRTFGGGKPTSHTVLVKGNRMATLMGDTASIVDVDAETITMIDYGKKQYSVITFAQMAEAMDKMAQKMSKDSRGNMDFKMDVKETGKTRAISGMDTREVIMTVRMEATDQQSGQKGSMAFVSSMWIAKNFPGYEEVRNLSMKMAQKVAWSPGATGMFRAQPGMQRGMAQMMKESAKLDGVPVLQLMRMGMVGADGNIEPPSPDAPPAPSGPTVGEAAGQAAGNAAGDAAVGAAASGVGGRLGRLGGLAGGLGGFGRRRNQQQQEQQQQQQPPAGQNAPPQGQAVMLEMHTELTSFSQNPVDASRLSVPAGFKQVEHELVKATK